MPVDQWEGETQPWVEGVFAGCGAQGDFAAQVGEIGFWDRVGEQFVDDGHEVMERADRSEGYGVGAASGAADGGQQEGGFDDRQGDLALPQLTNQAQVEAAQTAGRFGQPEIEIDHRLAISFPISGHGVSLRFEVFLRAAASSSLSRTR